MKRYIVVDEFLDTPPFFLEGEDEEMVAKAAASMLGVLYCQDPRVVRSKHQHRTKPGEEIRSGDPVGTRWEDFVSHVGWGKGSPYQPPKHQVLMTLISVGDPMIA